MFYDKPAESKKFIVIRAERHVGISLVRFLVFLLYFRYKHSPVIAQFCIQMLSHKSSESMVYAYTAESVQHTKLAAGGSTRGNRPAPVEHHRCTVSV